VIGMWRNLRDFLSEMVHAALVALDPGEGEER
jgi:hypothetical protein